MQNVLTKHIPLFQRKYFESIARILVLVGIFAVPSSAIVVNISMLSAVLFALLAGHWREKRNVVMQSPSAKLGLLFFSLFVIGVFYSQAPIKDTLEGLDKYAKIVYFLFFIPLFLEERFRKWAEVTFIMGTLLQVSMMTLAYFHVIDIYALLLGKYYHPHLLVDPIHFSVLVGIASFFMAHRFSDETTQLKWLYFIGILFSVYFLFFINIERTGYLTGLALIGLFFFQRKGIKGILIALGLILVLIFTSMNFSSRFQHRIEQTSSNLTLHPIEQPKTSLGLRMAFLQYGLKMIKTHPVFGTGTGSFSSAYMKTEGPLIDGYLGHPHNEFVLITIQLGGVGLLIFLIWLFIQWREMGGLPLNEKRLLQGVFAAFLMNSMCDVSLHINSMGVAYIVFLGVFLAAGLDKPNRIEK